MDGKMRVAVMTDVGKMGFTERAIPKPEPGEVLIQLEYVGICGSDMHYYETGKIGGKVVETPFVLGHEPSGVVVELGEGVRSLSLGDRVALEPGKTCGICEYCRTGRYNLCPDVIFFATPPVDGVFQEYVAHPADLCFQLPENMDLIEGALVEPLAIGFYAAEKAAARPGLSAVIAGAGCIGLVSLLALKAHGVRDILVTDVVPSRLEKAKELGATAVVDVSKEDAAAAVLAHTQGRGCDIMLETSGQESSAAAAVHYCKKGATVVLIGYNASGNMTLPVGLALDKEIRFETIFRYRHIYPRTIEAVANGLVDLRPIITNVFDFDDIQEAMDRSIRDKASIVKSVVKIRK